MGAPPARTATPAAVVQPAVPAATAATTAAATGAARPKIALVLSGGGARGLAHVGVLKALRELRIPVDMVAATSMGAIVGGAYAGGRTPDELEAFLRDADWTTIFSERPPRKDLSFRRKEDDLRFIGQTEFGIGRGGLLLPRGAVGSQNLEEFLRLLARPASEARHLDELPIPLRAVATDLVSGEQVVLRDVSLSVAMRASMSVPGAFAPTKVDDWLLGDGGLKRNLPVEVARDMGAEVIIAVNVGTPLLAREDLSSAFGVAQQMISILTEQNVGASIAALTATDVLVSPDLRGFSLLDFGRGAELVARGHAAVLAVRERLSALAMDEPGYEAWEGRRVRQSATAIGPVDAVVTEGARRADPRALEREVKDRAGIIAGLPASDAQLLAASRILYGSGDFERVDVRNVLQDGRRVVVLDVDEKPWGPDYVRLGGYALSNLRTEGRFSLTLQHTRTWINAWGAEWRNEFQLGDTRRFATSVYQPLGAGSPWFVEPLVQTVQSDFDVFGVDNRRSDRITSSRTEVAVTFGRRLGTTGVARIGGGYEWFRSKPAISSRIDGVSEASGYYTRFGGTFDTLDDANFPRSGYLLDATGKYTAYGSDGGPRLRMYLLQLLHAQTYARTTFLVSALAGRSRDDSGTFALGGFLNLSGTLTGAVSGSQAALLSLVTYYRMGELPTGIGRAWYAGVSLEAGNAWRELGEASTRDLRKAGSLLLGLDTVIGPLYVAWGHTLHGGSSVYLLLGGPSQRN